MMTIKLFIVLFPMHNSVIGATILECVTTEGKKQCSMPAGQSTSISNHSDIIQAIYNRYYF